MAWIVFKNVTGLCCFWRKIKPLLNTKQKWLTITTSERQMKIHSCFPSKQRQRMMFLNITTAVSWRVLESEAVLQYIQCKYLRALFACVQMLKCTMLQMKWNRRFEQQTDGASVLKVLGWPRWNPVWIPAAVAHQLLGLKGCVFRGALLQSSRFHAENCSYVLFFSPFPGNLVCEKSQQFVKKKSISNISRSFCSCHI